MTLRNWGRVLLTALAVAALTGAGQLGVAYGLGLLRFARTFEPGTVNQWYSHLAWIAFYGMVASVLGAVVASRALRRLHYPAALGSRMLLALAAGTGALAVAPLSMQQARAAVLPVAGSPALVAGLTAGLGAVAGILGATAVLSEGAVAWNVGTIATLTWLTALLSVTRSLGPTDAPPVVRLGVPDLSSQAGRTGQWIAMLAMPVAAVVVAVVVAGLARWLSRPPLAVAMSGLSGPALLALGYLIAGPGVRTGGNDQSAPYWGSLIAVAAGLLASTVVAAIRRRGGTPEAAGPPTEPTDLIPGQAVPPGSASKARQSAPDTPAHPPASTSTPRAHESTPTSATLAAEPHREAEHGSPGPLPTLDPLHPHERPEPGPAGHSPAAVPGPRSAPKPERRATRVAAADEEYLGWVQGLGAPGASEPPADRGRRKLSRRAVGSGRHQADQH